MALFTQYALAAAKMAWADAGLDKGGHDPERTAVILGNGIGGKEVDDDAYRTLFERGPARLSAMTIPKLIPNEAAGNISMALQIKGPVLTIVTACASGTDAMGAALDTIRAGRADMVLTGGTEATITEYCIGGFCALRALSTKYNDTPAKASRPFDKERDGFVMGEGAGILILEEYEHAVRRGARIYAEFAGYGMAEYAGGWLLTPDRPDAPLYLRPGASLNGADVSADGRWVSFDVNGGPALVHDSRTGAPAWEDARLSLGDRAKFTRDGRFLLQIGHPARGAASNDTTRLGRPADVAVDPAATDLDQPEDVMKAGRGSRLPEGFERREIRAQGKAPGRLAAGSQHNRSEPALLEMEINFGPVDLDKNRLGEQRAKPQQMRPLVELPLSGLEPVQHGVSPLCGPLKPQVRSRRW